MFILMNTRKSSRMICLQLGPLGFQRVRTSAVLAESGPQSMPVAAGYPHLLFPQHNGFVKGSDSSHPASSEPGHLCYICLNWFVWWGIYCYCSFLDYPVTFAKVFSNTKAQDVNIYSILLLQSSVFIFQHNKKKTFLQTMKSILKCLGYYLAFSIIQHQQ